jgi:phage terminase large subunit-like protein
MLTKEEIKSIINNPASSPLDQIKVIMSYINDLKNWKASSKNDDNADSLSMAIRKLKKLDRQ